MIKNEDTKSLWMKGRGHAVMVTNPCPLHPAHSPGSLCFWCCREAVPTSWRQAEYPRCPEPPCCCASSRSGRWVSPHVLRTRMDLSLDLDTTSEYISGSDSNYYEENNSITLDFLMLLTFCRAWKKKKTKYKNLIFKENVKDLSILLDSNLNINSQVLCVYIDYCLQTVDGKFLHRCLVFYIIMMYIQMKCSNADF